MKTKILSLALVVAMLASMLVVVPVSGATEKSAVVTTTNVAGNVGETVAVDVIVTTDAPVYGYTLAYEYDASKLYFEGLTFAISGGVENYDAKDGPAYTEVTHKGPYEVFGWTYNPKATTAAKDPINAMDGAVVATLNFTILDGASGDAYVAIRNLKRENGTAITELYTGMDGSTVSLKYVGDDIEYVESKVTILPEGYSTESTLPPVKYVTSEDAWEFLYGPGYEMFTLNDEGDGWIFGPIPKDAWDHLGFEGVVVLPSSITDYDGNYVDPGTTLPVVGIADDALYDVASKTGFSGVTAFVIPESVVSIGTRAFLKASASDYYILNPNCEIGKGAIASGVYNGTTSKWTTGPFVPKINNAAAIIHGVAGGSVEAFAQAPTEYKSNATNPYTSFTWTTDTALATENTLTFNGTKYYFTSGTEVTLPGMMEDADGNLVVAWNAGAVGSTITITEDIVLEPAKTIAKPVMDSTVGLLVTGDIATTRIRYTTDFAMADYEALADLGTVTMGTLITPARFVSKAGAMTREALDAFSAANGGAKTYIDVPTKGYFEKTGTPEENGVYTFAGSLAGFKAENIELEYAAVFYLTVTTTSGSFTVYSDFVFANNRSVDATITAATGSQLTDIAAGALREMIAANKKAEQ